MADPDGFANGELIWSPEQLQASGDLGFDPVHRAAP